MVSKKALIVTTCALGLAATLMLAPARASAPSVDSGINGAIGVLVTDVRDRHIEGAKVWYQSDSSGAKSNTLITDRNGNVFFPDIKPGVYTVIASHDDVGEGKVLVKVMRYRKSQVKVVLGR
jgi:uncharacterized protein (DUF2141 family)